MVHQAEGERNFHIFYQMLTGGAPVLLNQVKLQSDPEQYFYLSQVARCCTVKTLNIGTPRPATVVVLNIKQFNFTMK